MQSAYVLGFIFADGHLEDAYYIRGKYLRITNTDLSIMKHIKRVLNSDHKIVVTPASGKRKEKYLLRIGSHTIYRDLGTLNLHPRKSLDMTFPRVPVKFLPNFIRGYFDGDGTITFEHIKSRPHDRLKVIFTSGSKDFLFGLSAILSTCCLNKVGKVYDSKDSYQLAYRSKDALSVLRFIYDGISKEGALYLRRKFEKYRKLTSNPNKFRCRNLFDKTSRIWTYNTKRRRTQVA